MPLTPASVDFLPRGRAAARTSTARVEFLDGVRGAAALFVVLHHAYLTIWSGNPHGPYGLVSARVAPLTHWLLYGRAAVAVFIVLSGYCLMLPVVRRRHPGAGGESLAGGQTVAGGERLTDGGGWFSGGGECLAGGAMCFYRRRIRRIVPTYYAALAVSLLLILTLIGRKTGTHWDVSLPVTPRALLESVLLIQDYGKLGPINHAFWSIPVEVHIYLLFPLIVWLWSRTGGLATTAATGLAWLLARRFLGPHHLLPQSHWFILLFLCGAVAAAVANSDKNPWPALRRRAPWRAIAAAAVAGALLLLHYCGPYPTGRPLIAEDLSVGGAAAALLVAMALHERSLVRRVAEHKRLVAVGAFSYSLYLIHAPLLQVIWQYAIAPLHVRSTVAFALLTAVGTPLILLAAWLFYLLFERRFATAPRPRHDVAADTQAAAAADRLPLAGATA